MRPLFSAVGRGGAGCALLGFDLTASAAAGAEQAFDGIAKLTASGGAAHANTSSAARVACPHDLF